MFRRDILNYMKHNDRNRNDWFSSAMLNSDGFFPRNCRPQADSARSLFLLSVHSLFLSSRENHLIRFSPASWRANACTCVLYATRATGNVAQYCRCHMYMLSYLCMPYLSCAFDISVKCCTIAHTSLP